MNDEENWDRVVFLVLIGLAFVCGCAVTKCTYVQDESPSCKQEVR